MIWYFTLEISWVITGQQINPKHITSLSILSHCVTVAWCRRKQTNNRPSNIDQQLHKPKLAYGVDGDLNQLCRPGTITCSPILINEIYITFLRIFFSFLLLFFFFGGGVFEKGSFFVTCLNRCAPQFGQE